MKRLCILAAALASGACATRGLDAARPKESRPPELTVTEPARGTIMASGDTTVEVAGTASDSGSGLDTVKVNDTLAAVSADGSFHATINVGQGVTLLHTVAADKDGNTKTDSRAVMSGDLANPTATVADGLALRINDKTLTAIGDIGAEELTMLDVGAAMAPFNPIVDVGFTCLNAQVSLDSLTKSMVVLNLTPVAGGIAFDATIYDVDAEMSADFSAVCIPGSAGISLTASAYHLAGTFALGINNGQVEAGLANGQGSFDNFALSVGIIPASVLDLIPNLDQIVADKLTSTLQAKIPALVQKYLGGEGYAKTVTVMGENLDILIAPSMIDFSPTGGTIALDTTFTIEGQNGGAGYPRITAPMPQMPESEAPGAGFRLAMNDNALNQLLNDFWAAGLIDRSIDLNADPGNTSGLAGLVDRLDLYLPFPPVASSAIPGQPVTITVGDLMVTAVKHTDTGDIIVTKVAASAQIGLSAITDANGAVHLHVTTPTSYLDVIDDGVSGPNPLNDATVEQLGAFVIAHASSMIDSMVGAVPVPQFQSAQITNLQALQSPTGGYLEIGGNVTAN